MKQLGIFDRFIRGMSFSQPSAGRRILAFLFTSMFFGGGLLLASVWVFAFGDFFRMQSWDEVDAQVTSSELVESRDSDGDSTYRVLIRYDYEYRGEQCSGDRYDIGSSHTNVGVKRMKEIVEDHPEGKAITYSISGGPDANRFTIDADDGQLRFQRNVHGAKCILDTKNN